MIGETKQVKPLGCENSSVKSTVFFIMSFGELSNLCG